MSQYDDAVMADSPAGYWPLDDAPGSQLAHNLADLAQPASAFNVIFGSPGGMEDQSTAAAFDGVSSLLVWPGLGGQLPLPQSFDFWVSVPSLLPVGMLDTAPGDEALCNVDPGNISWRFDTIEFPLNLPDPNWHHVALVASFVAGARQLQYYLDGQLVGTFPGSANNYLVIAQQAQIGRVDVPDTGPLWFQGSIQKFAWYQTALSATSIGNHIAAASAPITPPIEPPIIPPPLPIGRPLPPCGPMIDTVLGRVFDPAGTGTSRDTVRDLLGRAAQVINAAFDSTIVSASMPTSPNLQVYNFERIAAANDVLRIKAVRRANRDLSRIDFSRLKQISMRWFGRSGRRFETFAVLGRRILIVHPQQSAASSINVVYTQQLPRLNVDADTVNLPSDNIPPLLKLTEALVLLKQRDLDKLKPLLDELTAELKAVKGEEQGVSAA